MKIYDSFLHRFRARLRQMSDHPRTYPETCRRVYVDNVDQSTLNARASESIGKGLIRIHRGCSVSLERFFSTLLSHRKILPTIGTPRAESQWREDLSPVDWIAGAHAVPKREPRDPERQRTAAALVTLAMDFIFLHEFGHIAGGHTRYFVEQHGMSELSEDDVLDLRVVDDRHLAEIDADAIAVQLSAYAWHDVKGPSRLLSYDDAVELAFLWGFAVGCLFFLFSRPAMRSSAHMVGTHPHPAVRLVRLMHEAIAAAEHFDIPVVPERVEEAWSNAVDEIQNAKSVVRFGSSISDVFDNDRSGVYDRAARLRHELRTFRADCAKYAERRPEFQGRLP